MNSLIMSDKYGCFCDELSARGFNIIPTDNISALLTPEQRHADMQCLKINNKIFILNECLNLKNSLHNENLTVISKSIEKSYPKNILLNCLFLNNILYGKLSAVADEVKSFCAANNINTVNINQGYARCSTLVIDENVAVTADSSIANALKNNGVEVLKITEGGIVLDGFDYGFIGGASAVINNDIFFFGNIKKHKDYKGIEDFILSHKNHIKILCPDYPLTDIGGVIML